MKFSEPILFARAAPSSAWTRRLGPKWRRSRTQSVHSLKDPDKDSSLGFWPIWRNIFHQGHETYPSEQNCWLCARKLWSSDKTCTWFVEMSFVMKSQNMMSIDLPYEVFHGIFFSSSSRTRGRKKFYSGLSKMKLNRSTWTSWSWNLNETRCWLQRNSSLNDRFYLKWAASFENCKIDEFKRCRLSFFEELL